MTREERLRSHPRWAEYQVYYAAQDARRRKLRRYGMIGLLCALTLAATVWACSSV